MSDTCAAPASKPDLVNVISAALDIVNHLRASPRDMALLKDRLANNGKPQGYHMTIAEHAPNIAESLYDDVAERISRTLLADKPRRIRRARRAVV